MYRACPPLLRVAGVGNVDAEIYLISVCAPFNHLRNLRSDVFVFRT